MKIFGNNRSWAQVISCLLVVYVGIMSGIFINVPKFLRFNEYYLKIYFSLVP